MSIERVKEMMSSTKELRALAINFMSLNPWEQAAMKIEDIKSIKEYAILINSKELEDLTEKALSMKLLVV